MAKARNIVEEAIKYLSKDPRELETSKLVIAITKATNLLDAEGTGDFAYDPKQKIEISIGLKVYCTELNRRVPK